MTILPADALPTAFNPPARGFSPDEFAGRTARAQRLMRDARLDALLVTAPPNFRYFSGFDSQFWESPTRPWFIVVPADGEPIAVIPDVAAPELARTWIRTIHTWPAPRPADDGRSLLCSVFAGLPNRHGRIGAELGREMALRMPVIEFMALRDAVPGFAFVDGSPCLWQIRQVKTPAEIRHIRYVCELASDAYRALPGLVGTGMTEREVARALRIDLARRGADSTPFLPVISGPGGVAQIVCGPGDRRLEAGDVMFIDTGSIYDGYFCDFDRVYAIGAIDDAAKRAHETVWQATEAGIAAAQPGATTDDLWAAMQAVLDAGGALGNNVGRSGHGLGMQLTEPPSNMPGDGTVLQPGMVMTIEPGMEYASGRMIVHEENVVITEDGCELLTKRAPREIWRVD
jgi:Xaa-Pro aminopeptidase